MLLERERGAVNILRTHMARRIVDYFQEKDSRTTSEEAAAAAAARAADASESEGEEEILINTLRRNTVSIAEGVCLDVI